MDRWGCVSWATPHNTHCSLTHHTQVGDTGLAALAKIIGQGFLATLKVLDLSLNLIEDEGLAAFAGAITAKGSLLQLQKLHFNSNQIGDDGIAALAKSISSGSLTGLKSFYVKNNPGDIGPMKAAVAGGGICLE